MQVSTCCWPKFSTTFLCWHSNTVQLGHGRPECSCVRKPGAIVLQTKRRWHSMPRRRGTSEKRTFDSSASSRWRSSAASSSAVISRRANQALRWMKNGQQILVAIVYRCRRQIHSKFISLPVLICYRVENSYVCGLSFIQTVAAKHFSQYFLVRIYGNFLFAKCKSTYFVLTFCPPYEFWLGQSDIVCLVDSYFNELSKSQEKGGGVFCVPPGPRIRNISGSSPIPQSPQSSRSLSPGNPMALYWPF